MTGHVLHIHHDGAGDSGVLLAGLDWAAQDASHPRRTGRLRLRWRGVGTETPSSSFPAEGAGALMTQMCLAAERDGHGTDGLWLWIARVREVPASIEDHETDSAHANIRWWLGGTDDGCPSRAVPEELHDTLSGLMLAVGGIATTSPLSGIGLCAACADEVRSALCAFGTELPEPVICTPRAPGDEEPRFGAGPRRSPAKLALVTATAIAALIAAAWTGGLISSGEPQAVAAVHVVPVAGSIETACLAGHDTVWPRAPGWIADASGCARSGHLPDELRMPDMDVLDLVIWRAWIRDGGANAVLADAAVAHMLKGWAHGFATRGNRLILWRTRSLESETVEPSAAPDESAPEESAPAIADLARHLGQVWADEPQAVGSARGIITVRVSDTPARAFARLARAGPGRPSRDPDGNMAGNGEVDLLSMTWTGARTTLRLRPRGSETAEGPR